MEIKVRYRCGHEWELGSIAPATRCPIDGSPKAALVVPRPTVAFVKEPTKDALKMEASR